MYLGTDFLFQMSALWCLTLITIYQIDSRSTNIYNACASLLTLKYHSVIYEGLYKFQSENILAFNIQKFLCAFSSLNNISTK